MYPPYLAPERSRPQGHQEGVHGVNVLFNKWFRRGAYGPGDTCHLDRSNTMGSRGKLARFSGRTSPLLSAIKDRPTSNFLEEGCRNWAVFIRKDMLDHTSEAVLRFSRALLDFTQ
ncbi:predicted protein [Histoplasma capsulatum H143]|uniref:Uncharacterized protein n=1 Tax=Ajellomyces capsulatus (strain H143) TaxID=544712 RepID=C6H4P4_AJECH|nr:predicted protein [Histoplasma capsulatum H143]